MSIIKTDLAIMVWEKNARTLSEGQCFKMRVDGHEMVIQPYHSKQGFGIEITCSCGIHCRELEVIERPRLNRPDPNIYACLDLFHSALLLTAAKVLHAHGRFQVLPEESRWLAEIAKRNWQMQHNQPPLTVVENLPLDSIFISSLPVWIAKVEGIQLPA